MRVKALLSKKFNRALFILIFGENCGKLYIVRLVPLNMDNSEVKIEDLEKRLHGLMDCL